MSIKSSIKQILKYTYWGIRNEWFGMLKCCAKRLELDAMKRVVVIAPHPDDEALGCGMLIKALTENGQKVDVVFLSRGEGSMPDAHIAPGEVAVKRHQLAIEANRELGVAEDHLYFLNFPDGEFAKVDVAEIDSFKKIVEDLNPDTILIPHPWEGGDDHNFATKVSRQIMWRKNDCHILFYCVWVYYHMPFIKIFGLNPFKARCLKEDFAVKRAAVDIYLDAKDINGNCYSGVLPDEFLNAVMTPCELYFKA